MPFWKSNSAARDALAQVGRDQQVAGGDRIQDGRHDHHRQPEFPRCAGLSARRDPGQASLRCSCRRRCAAARNIKAFWANLNRGEFQAAEYKRDRQGRPRSLDPGVLQSDSGRCRQARAKSIKFATDITAQKIRSMEDAGKIAAIGRAQAVIEFNLDGTIITANENFLATRRLLAGGNPGQASSACSSPPPSATAPPIGNSGPTSAAASIESAEYKRFGKGGKEVWILASYNPILDETGKPFKVVKFATDVSADKLKAANYAGQIEAIGKSQAVIEFNMDGYDPDREREFPRRARLFARRNPGQASQHVRRRRISATAQHTASSGPISTAASFRRANTSASARAARRSGSRPPIIRSSTSTASRSRS